MVAFQVPSNPELAQMRSFAQIKDLFFYFRRRSKGGNFRTRSTVNQASFILFGVGYLPITVRMAADSEVAALF